MPFVVLGGYVPSRDYVEYFLMNSFCDYKERLSKVITLNLFSETTTRVWFSLKIRY